jgi:hypothetical protein
VQVRPNCFDQPGSVGVKMGTSQSIEHSSELTKQAIECVIVAKTALVWSTPISKRTNPFFTSKTDLFLWMFRLPPELDSFKKQFDSIEMAQAIHTAWCQNLPKSQLHAYRQSVQRYIKVSKLFKDSSEFEREMFRIPTSGPMVVGDVVGMNAHNCAFLLVGNIATRIEAAIVGSQVIRLRGSENQYFDPETIQESHLDTIETALRHFPDFDAPIYSELIAKISWEAEAIRPKTGNFSPAERTILSIVRSAGRRLVTEEILKEIEARNGTASIGTTKQNLANLVRRGELSNRHDVDPKGYGLPEWS